MARRDLKHSSGLVVRDPFLAGSDSYALTVSNATQTTIMSSDAIAMGELFSSPPTISGYPATEASAMRISAFYRCISLLCGIISTLPIHLYKYLPNGDKEKVPVSRIYSLLNLRPNLRYSAAVFWEAVLRSVFLQGDGIAWIKRKGSRNPTVDQIIFFPHYSVRVQEMDEGDLGYYVFAKLPGSTETKEIRIPSDDILHFPGFGFDGVHGMSLLSWGARNAVSVAGTAEQQQASMISTGGTMRHIFKSPKGMSKEQKDDLRTQYQELVDTPNRMLPFVLTGGMEVDQISMTALDAQLLETRNFQVEEIARVCGVPPYLIGATTKVTSFGKGLEEMGRGFLIYTVQPIVEKIQQELNYKLFGFEPQDGLFLEFNTSAIARADLATRMGAYRQAVGGSQGPGWLTVNEIRAMERHPSVGPEGDKLYEGHSPSGSEPDDGDPKKKDPDDPEEEEDQ